LTRVQIPAGAFSILHPRFRAAPFTIGDC